MGLLAPGLCSNFIGLWEKKKLLSCEEPRAPFVGTFSTANLRRTTSAAALRTNCSCRLVYLQVCDATAHNRVCILHVATCYLIHPYPSRILISDISFCFILSRTNPIGMCESHSKPPGLRLFTTSPSHEWFIKSCITIMTHCLSLFTEERWSGADNWLEFQNNINISEENFSLYG